MSLFTYAGSGVCDRAAAAAHAPRWSWGSAARFGRSCSPAQWDGHGWEIWPQKALCSRARHPGTHLKKFSNWWKSASVSTNMYMYTLASRARHLGTYSCRVCVCVWNSRNFFLFFSRNLFWQKFQKFLLWKMTIELTFEKLMKIRISQHWYVYAHIDFSRTRSRWTFSNSWNFSRVNSI